MCCLEVDEGVIDSIFLVTSVAHVFHRLAQELHIGCIIAFFHRGLFVKCRKFGEFLPIEWSSSPGPLGTSRRPPRNVNGVLDHVDTGPWVMRVKSVRFTLRRRYGPLPPGDA